jgi:hypothetical protein
MRRIVALTAIGAALVLAGCRPEVEFDLDGRQSKIDRVVIDASVQPDGVVRVSQRYTFEDDGGSTVALPAALANPALPPGILPGVRNVTVDGQAVTPTNGLSAPELRVRGEEATVAYEVVSAVDRYQDVAILGLETLPSPDDASRQDPNVELSGTLTLPEGTPGPVDARLHGGRDTQVTVDGRVVRFSAEAPIWNPNHELDVAFPSGLVPGLAALPVTHRSEFQLEQSIKDGNDRSFQSTLDSLDDQEDLSRWIITGVAFGLPAIFWLIVLKGLIGRLHERRSVVHDVPKELVDPPAGDDPAVVAVLEGEGRPDRDAVAGTVLGLAHRKALDIQQYGDKVVVKVPLTTTAANGSEQIVLDALRHVASPEGVVEGPPIWSKGTRWWKHFRRDAVRQARDAGLVTKWLPLAPLSGALITTGIGFSLFFFTQPWIYFTMVFGVQIVGYVISFITGYTLTKQGWRNRALWHAFARYIDKQGRFDKDVGPAGVVMWGPYLVYGSVLGEARAAARPLRP